MKYQIDQSGKIERTNKDTVLACSNSLSRAVILPAKEKRRLQEWFRQNGMPRLFIDATLSTLLYILINKFSKHTKSFTVDIEYPGHTKIITQMVNKLTTSKVNIHWQRIGKNSPAHNIAYQVYRKKLHIGHTVTAEKVWKLAKKTAGGRLSFGLSPKGRRSVPAYKKNIAKKTKKVKKKWT